MGARTTRGARRRASALGAAAALVLLPGCSADDAAEVAGTPASSGSAAATGAAGAFPLPAGWPARSVPVPPGGTTEDTSAAADSPSFVVFDVGMEDAMAFYREALPAEGWQLLTDTTDPVALTAERQGAQVLVLGSSDPEVVSVVLSRPAG
ncbi:hypothetical protein [Modestobacter roseus]|uniref:Lipoprotein n=1 Tax=Modestobacter roseus TaxID=1181884 RepID=A0A562IUW9_9ACTN|nr:hypothetical protein [Modestobacter roseus]MQA32982.1 hypothetical protein [Modestobacter roseus]TWH74563.1 hypothetical protein JD78_03107 [Modestobacter roseus]